MVSGRRLVRISQHDSQNTPVVDDRVVGLASPRVLDPAGNQGADLEPTLADRFHRSKVAAFHLITNLEKQGAVVRKPNPADGRSNLVYLTEDGREIAAKLIPLAQENLDWALDGISAEEIERTKEVLYKIAVNMTE